LPGNCLCRRKREIPSKVFNRAPLLGMLAAELVQHLIGGFLPAAAHQDSGKARDSLDVGGIDLVRDAISLFRLGREASVGEQIGLRDRKLGVRL